MKMTGFANVEQATHLLDEALSVIGQIRDGAFWKLPEDDQLNLGRQLEKVSRVIFAAQVHQAGEINTQRLAQHRGCSSTAALLREAFNISAADANARVRAAAEVLPHESISGGDIPPALPLLATTLDAGEIGPEHTRTIVETMSALPPKLPAETRALGERSLVDNAKVCDPTQFRAAARIIAERLDPDGKIDDRPSASKMELSIGNRSVSTGLTPFGGRLDDFGIEVLRKSIDPLSTPRPEVNGVKDLRPAANRRAQGLIDALKHCLDAGNGPTQGGEVPHITVVMEWDALQSLMVRAMYDSGHPASAHTIRRLLCDAQVLPVVLGGDGRLPSVGRLQRTFPRWIRKAIIIRDQGCAWPGCDRPPAWCDGHHIGWWQRDFGETSYANGVLLCGFHHTEIHRGEWQIQLASDGIPEFIPPKWIDPAQVPRRNTLHRVPSRT